MKRALNKQLQTIGKKIKKEYRVEKVILFGSYAKGNASEDSDGTCGMVFPYHQSF